MHEAEERGIQHIVLDIVPAKFVYWKLKGYNTVERNVSYVENGSLWRMSRRVKAENASPHRGIRLDRASATKDTIIFTMWNYGGGVLRNLRNATDLDVRDVTTLVSNVTFDEDDQMRVIDWYHQGRVGRLLPVANDAPLCIAAIQYAPDEQTGEDYAYVMGLILVNQLPTPREGDCFIKHGSTWRHLLTCRATWLGSRTAKRERKKWWNV